MTTKKQQEDEKKQVYQSIIVDLEDAIQFRIKMRDKAKIYVDAEQAKLDYAILRKEHYVKTGVLLPVEQDSIE